MEQDTSFLKFLIDEEIYMINENKPEIVSEPDVENEPDIENELDIEDEPDIENEPDVPPGEIFESPALNRQRLKFRNTSVVLLDYQDMNSLPKVNNELLAKILKSVKLDVDEVVKVFKEQFDQINEKSFENCSIIGFFLHLPANLSPLFSTPPYKIGTSGNNKFLYCDQLEMIHEDKALKRKLWEQLKVLYNIP